MALAWISSILTLPVTPIGARWRCWSPIRPVARWWGGLTGRTSLGLWFVDLFHLPAAYRGNGLGSRVLKAAEDEARRRGCRSGVLYTLSFQAPDFYVKHGWVVFGRVPCDPVGTCRVFLSKDLSAG